MNKFSATADRIAQFCASCIATIFLLSGVAYLCLGHWTVTHADFWRIYDVCLNHTWFESALLKHNGHSLFFPSFIWLADLRFFHGDQQLLFYVGLTLLFISTGLLLIPVWRDNTVDSTSKIIATLVVIVGTFWVGRAMITASGGFNCIGSLLMIGAEASFICLPSMRTHSTRFWAATFVVIAGGFVASFSFTAGLATWPVLLLLAWSLRLPWRCFALITAAAIAAAVVFLLLPPRGLAPEGLRAVGLTFSVPTEISYLCRLLIAPFFYAASGWQSAPGAIGLIASSFGAVAFGAATLTVATTELVYAVIRRDLSGSSLRLIGIALVAFNLVALGLVVVGRSGHFRALPFELAAPRYLFHTTLFWTGVLLAAIQHAGSTQWIRWPVYFVIFALSILAFPSHYVGALHCRWARHLAQIGAISLINGVRDDEEIRIFLPAEYKNLVYRLSDQLRLRRLDMFHEGLQDWIGVSESTLFDGRHKRERLEGQCRITATVPCDNGKTAARIVGVAWINRKAVPKRLVIVDPTGIVCGIARSSAVTPLTDQILYLNRFPKNMGFVGYIRSYDPKLQYSIRSADGGALSDEKIVVPPVTSLPGA